LAASCGELNTFIVLRHRVVLHKILIRSP